jgi:hypothetical protein
MMGRLRMLALIGTVVAFLAVGASPALASTSFETEAYPGLIGGKQTGEGNSLLLGASEVSCATTTFSGELTQPASTLTLEPKYAECVAFGLPATVETGGCVYVLHAGAEIGANEFEGTTDISCPPGHAIVISTKSCVIEVGAQSGLSGVVYQDTLEESPAKVRVEENVGKVKYSMSGSFFCKGSKEDGKYIGPLLLEASREGGSGLEAQGVAVAKDGPTKLCEELPNPGCKSVAPAKTLLEGPGATAPLISIGSTSVQCSSSNSKFSAKTEAKEGEPLKFETFSMTLTGCQANKKTACGLANVSNSSAATIVANGVLGPGRGDLFVGLKLRLECKGEINCEYKAPAFTMHFTGGKPADVYSGSQGLITEALGGGAKEENCAPNAKMLTTFSLTTPKAGIWASR